MEPLEELSHNMATLLEDIAEKRPQLDRQGQKALLESLGNLLLALNALDEQLMVLTKVPARDSSRIRSSHQLYRHRAAIQEGL